MTLEFLGVGSAFAKRHHQNNLLVNGNILVDCAASAGRSLHETGRSFEEIESLFITHTHADHIGGLEECAFLNRYTFGGRKPTIHLPPALMESLWDHSLRGGLEDPEHGATQLQDYFDIVEAMPRFEIDGVRFEIVPTFHVPGRFCCGLIIDGRVLFSGDTQFAPDTIDRHGSDAQAIFHDCQFHTGGIHASLDELAALPEEIRRKTYLMHYADDWQKHLERAEELGFRWAQQHTAYAFD
jgi:ribonuclease BN (tRNA processing enzyme)